MIWSRGIEHQVCTANSVFYITPSPDKERGAELSFDVSRSIPVANENRLINCSVDLR
jgi:hypothetical protein